MCRVIHQDDRFFLEVRDQKGFPKIEKLGECVRWTRLPRKEQKGVNLK